jgi:hypothetical protein
MLVSNAGLQHTRFVQSCIPVYVKLLILWFSLLVWSGGFYEIDHGMLPPRTPIHLKSIRVVKVRILFSLCRSQGFSWRLKCLIWFVCDESFLLGMQCR